MQKSDMVELLTFFYAQWSYVEPSELLTAQWQVAFEGVTRDRLYNAMVRALTETSRGQPPTIGEVNLFLRANSQNEIRNRVRNQELQQKALPRETRYSKEQVDAMRAKNLAFIRQAAIELGKKRSMINETEKLTNANRTAARSTQR